MSHGGYDAFSSELGAASLERAPDSFDQCRPIEALGPRQVIDVEEIFDAAVADPKRHDLIILT